MRLEQIIKIRQSQFNVASPAKKPVDLAAYPWDECIADQMEKYGDEETAKRICGAIKALNAERQQMDVVKEGFPIPSPSEGEAEADYVSRCMKEIGSEYDTQEQALAVCYAQLEKK